jgi:DHA1 family tetracycline resistance protein-like MFS transporter
VSRAPRVEASAGSLPTLLAVVFVDLLGFSLILPLLPFYADTFGASPTVVGLLVASYAAAQLVGAPLLGTLSDRFGRRPVLILSILGTALGFLVFGLATTLWLLFASRMLDGLTGGNISVAQAYIADVSPPEKRTRNFGLIGAAFGLGFIIGPAMGGFLSRWGFAVPAFVAAGMATLNAVAVWIFLPESLPRSERSGSAAASARPRPRGWRHLKEGDRAGGLLWIRFWFALAFVTFQTIFALWAQYRLGLNAEQTGYILGYVGVLIVVVQAGIVGPVSRRYREGPVILTAIVLMSVALAAWAFAPSVPVLMMIQAPIALAGGLFGATANSAISRAVLPHEIGGVLGIGASLESVTRALAPSLGGVLLGRIGTWAPGVFASVILVLLFPFALTALRRPSPEAYAGRPNPMPAEQPGSG